MERQQRGVGGGEVLFGSRDGQQFRVQLSCSRSIFLRRRSRFIIDHKHFALQERTILINGHYFEAVAAFGDQVEAPIRILFHDGHDFGGASHFGETLFERTNHAKRAAFFQAFRDHFLVTWFENVQRQGSVGK